MSTPVDLIAIIHPATGKEEHALSLLQNIAKYVEANEPGCLRYEIVRRTNEEDGPEIVMLERYKDEEAQKAHGTSEAFGELIKAAQEKGFLRKPIQMIFGSVVDGFAAR